MLCNKSLNSPDDVVTVQQKGAEGINHAALELGVDIIVTAGISVHIFCRIKFTQKKDIQSSLLKQTSSNTLSSETEIFASPKDLTITVRIAYFVGLLWISL